MKKIILILLVFSCVTSYSQNQTFKDITVKGIATIDTTKATKAVLFMNGLAYAGFKYTGSVKKIYTLPATDGTTGQVLSTNGSSLLSWNSLTDTALYPFLGTQNAFTKYNSFAQNVGITGNLTVTGDIACDDFTMNGDTMNIFDDNITGLTYLNSLTGNIANSTTPLDTIFSNVMSNGNSNITIISATLADNGSFNLASGRSGLGIIQLGDGEEYAWFSFTTAGVVTLITNSANVTTTLTTNNTLNIGDGGAYVKIENTFAATKKVTIQVIYNN